MKYFEYSYYIRNNSVNIEIKKIIYYRYYCYFFKIQLRNFISMKQFISYIIRI